MPFDKFLIDHESAIRAIGTIQSQRSRVFVKQSLTRPNWRASVPDVTGFSPNRFECRATPEDTVSLYGLSFGIGILSTMAASLVFTILLTIVSLVVKLPGDPTAAMVLIASAWVGYLVARAFVRWRRRIAAERTLLIDAAGITYVAYADRNDTTRWEEIERVEHAPGDSDTSYTLVVRRRGRRALRLDGSEFTNEDGIVKAIRPRLPSPDMWVKK
jgi:hypothetical protein